MSRRAQTRTMLERTSQPRRAASLFLAPTAPELELCNSPSIPSPIGRPFAWRRAEKCGETFGAVHPRPARMPDPTASDHRGASAIWLRRHPYIDALQMGVSAERHLSRIFPAHPRSLALVLIPRPAALRVSASAYQPPCGFRLSENLCAKKAKRFSEPSEKAPLGTWERGTSRRFAQECPEGNPGKYKQGESQWHSTKTKSL